MLHSKACGHDSRGCRRPTNGKLDAIMTAASARLRSSRPTTVLNRVSSESFDSVD